MTTTQKTKKKSAPRSPAAEAGAEAVAGPSRKKRRHSVEESATAVPTAVPPETGAAVAEVTSSVVNELRPADRAAVLLALSEAFKDAADEAKGETLNLAALAGAKSFRTPLGTISVTQKDAPIRVNDALLLSYLREHDPEAIETVEQVVPWKGKAIIGRLAPIAGKVYDTALLPKGTKYAAVEGVVVREDGEVVEPVPFATVGDAPAPYVSWPASTEKRFAQSAVRDWVGAELANITSRAIEASQ